MWLLPSFVKEVPYAKMRFINLTSARKLKADLDETVTPQNVITDTKCNSNAKCNNF